MALRAAPRHLPTITALLLVLAPFCAVGQAQKPQNLDEATRFLSMMSDYAELSQRLVEMAQHPETAIMQAVEGVVEIYEARGDKAKAVDHLERVLERARQQSVRNILHLKLRDLYNETGRSTEALAQLDRMIEENLAIVP